MTPPESNQTTPRTGSAIQFPRALVPTARFVVSVAAASAVCLLVWRRVPPSLTGRTSVVGYPTFADFDPNRYYDAFYLVTILFPILAILFYYLVGLPFVRRRSARRPLMFPVPVQPAASAIDQDTQIRGVFTPISALVRATLPAIVISGEVSIQRSSQVTLITHSGIVAGIGYLVAVVVLGVILHSVSVRAGHGRARQRSLAANLPVAMSTVNAVLGLTVIPLLYGVSGSTSITVGSATHVVRYPWLPLWLVVLLSAGAAWWTMRSLRKGTSPWDARHTEARTLMIAVGSIAVFLGTANFPGGLTTFSGFDDSQYLAAPQLIFGHGLLPWSQVLAFHGLLYDVFEGALGMAVFGNNRWGVTAGQQLLLTPATWIGFYLMGAYFLRRQRILATALVLAIILGFVGYIDIRWLLYPFLFIGLDKVLRKRSTWWSVVFTVAVSVQAIVVPESDLITAILLLIVPVFEFCTRHPDGSWRQNLFRTARCLVTGGLFLLCFGIYLLGTQSLGAFYQYYVATVPGHNLEGAKPISRVGDLLAFGGGPSLRYTVELLLPIVLILLTAWLAAAKLRRRSPWDTAQWVMVAAALGTIAYYTEALARADTGHIAEMFMAVLPLVFLWVREIANFVDRTLRKAQNAFHRARSHRPALLKVVASTWIVAPVIALIALVTIVVYAPVPLKSLRSVPSHFHSSTPVAAPAELPRLGYTDPGAVDDVQIEDLGKTIDTYAGPGAPVFDFDNEPGVLYYLLNRVPGTRFFFVAGAETAPAQRLLVDDLKKSNPRLVVYTDSPIEFGLPVEDSYNGVFMYDMVQNYIVSEYLLDHYRPLVSVQGQLLMLRDDLFGKVPALPHLAVAPSTQNLYYSMAPCAWGYTPNFLPQPVLTGKERSIDVGVSKAQSIAVTLTGWAVDDTTLNPALSVVAVRGSQAVASVQPTTARADVVAVLKSSAALMSGFSLSVPPGTGPLTLFALNSDGTASPISGQGVSKPGFLPSSITLSNGDREGVVVHPGNGHVDSVTSVNETILRLLVPPGTDLSRIQWITVVTNGGDGHQQFALSNLVGNASHEITWWALPQGGARISIQVGSCVQWHGFDNTPLYLAVHGRGVIRSVTLST